MTIVFPANAKFAIGVPEPPLIHSLSRSSTLLPSGTPVRARRQVREESIETIPLSEAITKPMTAKAGRENDFKFMMSDEKS
jgi:hypothetical protein